jgi:hypothetical protein
VLATVRQAPGRTAHVEMRPYATDLAPAVRAFNARLAAHGVHYQFPILAPGSSLERLDAVKVLRQSYVAVDEGGDVRGGYLVKYQAFQFHGDTAVVGFYQLPLSEGVIDPQYGSVGVRLLSDALKRQPDLYVLGVGGQEEPLARMVRGLGWPLAPVPFHFKIVNGFRFARNIRHLRQRRPVRWLLDGAAFSGAAWACARVADRMTRRRPPSATSAQLTPGFGGEADEVWSAARSQFAMLGVRDAATLAVLYPEEDHRFLRVVVRREGRPIGWAVLLDSPMRSHRHFGDLRVGTIVDLLARREESLTVVLHAARLLMERGVDLIISNQQAACWTEALERAGFAKGPSSFLFGISKRLARRLEPLTTALPMVHVNRGDGDGPINL